MANSWWPSFNVQFVLSWANGSTFSGNLSAFDVIGSKVQEIAGNDINTIGNEESCLWQHRTNLCHQSSIVPYSTVSENHSIQVHLQQKD